MAEPERVQVSGIFLPAVAVPAESPAVNLLNWGSIVVWAAVVEVTAVCFGGTLVAAIHLPETAAAVLSVSAGSVAVADFSAARRVTRHPVPAATDREAVCPADFSACPPVDRVLPGGQGLFPAVRWFV